MNTDHMKTVDGIRLRNQMRALKRRENLRMCSIKPKTDIKRRKLKPTAAEDVRTLLKIIDEIEFEEEQ